MENTAYQLGLKQGIKIGLRNNNKTISRKSMKCHICYSEELGEVSDIKNSDERFEAMNDFFITIQEIVRRETEIELLRDWRRFMRK